MTRSDEGVTPSGLPRGTSRLDRAGAAIAVVACTWFFVAAAWEMFGPFDAGHDAATASIGIAAVEMSRWGLLAPVVHFLPQAPTNADLYCHHPWGVFWVTAVLVKLLGPHDWVLRLAPISMSAATPPLIFFAARRLWGTPAAGLSAAAFTVTPLAVAFADFNALEVPVMFGLALTIWAWIRFRESWRRRYLWISLLGLAHALNSDWPAFVFTGIMLGFGLLRGTLFARRWYEPVDQRRFWLGWALTAGLAAAVGLFYLGALHHLGQLEPLLRQAEARSSGSDLPLAEVLAARRHWIELSFTPVGIALGKLAVPILVVRVVLLRRDLEALPLAVLVMAVVQYVVFKQGADVHVFWPQYFALYLAYAVGALVASLSTVVCRLLARWGRIRRWAPAAAFVVGLAPLVVMFPDAVSTLRYARRTGKRFDDGWRLLHQDADKIALARRLSSRLPAGQPVALHVGMKPSWALEWALRHPVRTVRFMPQPGFTMLVDSRFAQPDLLIALGQRASVQAFGPFWVARAAPHPDALIGFRITREEPSAWRRYFVDAHDPSFGFEPDPLWTWELRVHLSLSPNPIPSPASSGRGPEALARAGDDGGHLRIAHNMAIASGDESRAAQLRQQLEARLHPIACGRPAAGLTLLGYEWLPSVAPRLRVYVLAAGPTPHPWQAHVTSRVLRRPWSTVSPPHAIRQVGMPFPLPSTLFRAGFIYASESEIREQPGIERYRVQLVGPDGAGELCPLFDL